MSYDLAVWFSPRRISNKKAESLYESLGEEESLAPFMEPNASIHGFLSELTFRYPQAHEVPNEEIDDVPWSYDFEMGEGYCVLGMGFSRVEEVVPFVRQLAKRHGLVCFDPPAGSGLPSAAVAVRVLRALTAPHERSGGTGGEFEPDCILEAMEGEAHGGVPPTPGANGPGARQEAVGARGMGVYYYRAPGRL